VNAQVIVGLTLKASIMLTLLGFGMQSSEGDVFYLLKRPALLARSLAAMFVIMPLFAVLLTELSQLNAAVEIALVALAISPVPPLLPKKGTKGGGIAPYGVGLMATAASLSIVIIPLETYIIGKYFHRPFFMGPMAVAKMVVVSVIIPLAVGTLLRRFAPAVSARVGPRIIHIAGIVLLLGIACILAFAFPTVWSLVGAGTVLAIIAFVVVGIVVGHLLGGPDPAERETLGLSTACRHPGLAIAIAGTNIPAEHNVTAAVLLYAVINALLTIPYMTWARKKAAAHATALHAL
jgi:BASS family bile acid:Na+ symporter